MSSVSFLPLTDSQIVVGFGSTCIDFLAEVRAFPQPNQKIRTTNFKVQDDTQGRAILEELEADGVDTSFFVVSKEGTSSFSYIIVDSQAKTRTCIFTSGYPRMVPEDLSRASLSSVLKGATVVYFDGTLHETGLVIAQEAAYQNIPILIDAENPKKELNDLLRLADYVVCSEKFPLAWTGASFLPRALVSMLLRLPKIRFVIATLGEKGCIMLERCADEGPQTEEIEVESALESLEIIKDDRITMPTCISSSQTKFKAEGIGTVCGRLYVGTAEKIPPSELIDTTGAGDAFIGAVLYAICANFSPEKMLQFASCVAAANCRAIGARSGLPYRTDPRLSSFFD